MMNATQFIFGENRTFCQFGAENLYYSFYQIVPDLYNKTENFTLLNAMDSFFNGLSQVNTIVYSCYYGTFEV